MDYTKEGIAIGHGIGRGEIVNFIRISFKSNINRSTSTGNHQKEMRLSPQSECKQLTSYATLRGYFIHNIQKSYGQGGQYLTKNLRNMTEVDLNVEDPTIKLSKKERLLDKFN